MALDSTKVRVAVTGALYVDITNSATAPTGTASALAAGFKDQGYVSEDGVTLTLPDGGDVTNLKAWQGNATVRVIRSPSEDSPQLSFTLIETKLETIQTVFGVTVTQTSTEGAFVYDSNATRTTTRLVLDVVDGAELIRAYAPQFVVTSIGEVNLTSTDAIGWQVTGDMQRDTTLGGNFKSWMTALKTP